MHIVQSNPKYLIPFSRIINLLTSRMNFIKHVKFKSMFVRFKQYTCMSHVIYMFLKHQYRLMKLGCYLQHVLCVTHRIYPFFLQKLVINILAQIRSNTSNFQR